MIAENEKAPQIGVQLSPSPFERVRLVGLKHYKIAIAKMTPL